jgi:hypothetical protein
MNATAENQVLMQRAVWRSRSQFARAIRTGRIIRQPCSICGEPNADAHHQDYNRPLDVQWLCTFHHLQEHKRIREAVEKRRTRAAARTPSAKRTRSK